MKNGCLQYISKIDNKMDTIPSLCIGSKTHCSSYTGMEGILAIWGGGQYSQRCFDDHDRYFEHITSVKPVDIG
jgi:hypothetical protein